MIAVIFITNMILIGMVFYTSLQIAEVYGKIRDLEEDIKDEQKTVP